MQRLVGVKDAERGHFYRGSLILKSGFGKRLPRVSRWLSNYLEFLWS